ncbi:hypothetical protein CM49_03401 [Paenibacillus sp. P1XP2]|nr:hypothetical protein CM49_03401 [Paenibacillus sp. P1XP2]
MMIHMTYRSGEYKVKGYLSLPYGYEIEPETLEAHIRKIYGGKRLPMTVIANNAKRERLDIHERKWPVLVYCRGGIGRVGQVKTEWLERFSQSGFIVFAPVYRGTQGGEGRDEFGGADLEDVPAACRLLAGLPFVDPKRIAAMGFSRGSVNARPRLRTRISSRSSSSGARLGSRPNVRGAGGFAEDVKTGRRQSAQNPLGLRSTLPSPHGRTHPLSGPHRSRKRRSTGGPGARHPDVRTASGLGKRRRAALVRRIRPSHALRNAHARDQPDVRLDPEAPNPAMNRAGPSAQTSTRPGRSMLERRKRTRKQIKEL